MRREDAGFDVRCAVKARSFLTSYHETPIFRGKPLNLGFLTKKVAFLITTPLVLHKVASLRSGAQMRPWTSFWGLLELIFGISGKNWVQKGLTL